ncbi:putative nck-associated protein [Medicago truncatula]|uniref:Putative nck-associated protein n=1 Tax=Medicago truncatula TaxID=3880 RepID=A0A396IE21_MEDTR|nr:putative nck-associated protein [Medicago truncatula]
MLASYSFLCILCIYQPHVDLLAYCCCVLFCSISIYGLSCIYINMAATWVQRMRDGGCPVVGRDDFNNHFKFAASLSCLCSEREYMRECILGNFRRRLLGVLKTDNDLQRPSVLESLTWRHVSIVHLAEQLISMDITQGIREVFLSEAFLGPVSSLHLFEKPADQHTGDATESVCNWYIENIIKDVSGAGILFVAIHKCFRSTRPVGGYFAESVTDISELQAFIHIFGGYGVDRLDRMLKEHTAALLNCIDTSLHAGDRIEREASMKQIVDLETLIDFCIQAGLALAFDRLLSEASGAILEEGAPLIHSLLTGNENSGKYGRCCK